MSDFPRVAEADATGKVQAAFVDIKTTLGVAAVGRLFEELAVYPWFLQLAWRNLKPNASTAYFHRIARELEDMGVRTAGRRRHRATNEGADVSPLEARLDLDAKLLTSAAALRYGTNGQLPKMLWLAPSDKQTVAPTKIDIMPADEPEPVEENKLAIELRRHAGLCAESLPYRMEISATACRQSGLSEDDIDAVRAIVNAAWDRQPRALLAAASMTASGAMSASSEPVAAA